LSEPEASPGTPKSIKRERVLAFVFWTVVTLIVAFLLFNSSTIRHGGTSGDFPVFFVAGQGIVAGDNIYIKPENAGEYIYPPFLAWVFGFISPTGQAASAWIWGVCNALMLSASLVIGATTIARRFDLKPVASGAGAVALLALLLNLDKAKSVFSGGQTDLVTVLGVTLAMAWHQKRPALAGFFLALAGIVKYVPLAFLGLLLLRRGRRTACWSVAFFVLLALLPAITIGWSRNLELWSIALGGVARLFGFSGGELFAGSIKDATHQLSVSVTSAFTRWMLPEPGKTAALAASGLVALGVLAITWRMYARAGVPLFRRNAENDPDRDAILAPVEWAGGVVSLLVFSPQTQGRHLVLLLPFYLVCAGLLIRPTLRPSVRRAKWIMIAAVALFFAAMTLPPGSRRFYDAQMWWRSVGGATWCLLPAWFALLNLAMKTSEPRAPGTVAADLYTDPTTSPSSPPAGSPPQTPS
jgi:hypothetical protein